MTKRGILIASGATILGGIGIYVVVNRANKKKMIDAINKVLDSDKGVTGTAEDVAEEDAFNPTFYKKIPKAVILTAAAGDAMAKRLKDDIGTFTDDEEDIIKALTAIRTKAKLSFISERFQLKYGMRLGKFLTEHVDKGTNLQQIQSIVRSMPNN